MGRRVVLPLFAASKMKSGMRYLIVPTLVATFVALCVWIVRRHRRPVFLALAVAAFVLARLAIGSYFGSQSEGPAAGRIVEVLTTLLWFGVPATCVAAATDLLNGRSHQGSL